MILTISRRKEHPEFILGFSRDLQEKFENSRIRIRKSKDRQYQWRKEIGQKDTQRSIKKYIENWSSCDTNPIKTGSTFPFLWTTAVCIRNLYWQKKMRFINNIFTLDSIGQCNPATHVVWTLSTVTLSLFITGFVTRIERVKHKLLPTITGATTCDHLWYLVWFLFINL